LFSIFSESPNRLYHIIIGLCNGVYVFLHNTCPSATVFSFYIFTFVIFRKLNKPQLTKIKQQNFIGIHAFDSRLYLDISRFFKWKESFIFRYFKVFQVSQMFTCGLSDLLLLVVGSLVIFVLREYILKVHILVSSEHILCVGSFNMDWRILVFYPEPDARDKIS
jgi:hypothetical protein